MCPLRDLCAELSGSGKAVDFRKAKESRRYMITESVSAVSAARKMCPKKAIKVK